MGMSPSIFSAVESVYLEIEDYSPYWFPAILSLLASLTALSSELNQRHWCAEAQQAQGRVSNSQSKEST
jgi:hypothetical protein